MIWPAPAKLNLFLHVVSRRPDGYHLLHTAFQFLDYSDELSLRVTTDGSVRRTTVVAGVPEEDDLCLRAARLLKTTTGCAAGIEIALTKRIPIGGGLGGGSSDAATCLLALNELWKLGLTRAELARVGLQLGADVPVFIHGRAAQAQGVGELLTPIEPPEPWYLVVAPPVHVSTAEVFALFAQEKRLTPHTPPRTIRDLREGHGHNDLEPLVRKRFPAVARAFEWLAAFGRPRLTGSGGCVYADLAEPEHGRRALRELPDGFSGFVARGVNRHPLLQRQA